MMSTKWATSNSLGSAPPWVSSLGILQPKVYPLCRLLQACEAYCPGLCCYLSLVLPFQKRPAFCFPSALTISIPIFIFVFHKQNAAIVLVLKMTEGVRTECTGVGLDGVRTRTCQQEISCNITLSLQYVAGRVCLKAV